MSVTQLLIRLVTKALMFAFSLQGSRRIPNLFYHSAVKASTQIFSKASWFPQLFCFNFCSFLV